MPKGIYTDPKIKAEIIHKIRHQGVSVKDASAEYNLATKTIYLWLRDGVVDGNRNLILENKKLQKELEICHRIIGRMSVDVQRPKG